MSDTSVDGGTRAPAAVPAPRARRPAARSPRRRGPLNRLLASARYAAPALLGYAAVRAVGLVLLALWDLKHGTHSLHRLSTMWDAYWYQDIAVHGYAGSKPVPGPNGPYQAYAFFPVYPALIKLVWSLLPLPVNYAALLVAWVGALAAAWGIFAVAARLYGRRTGVIAAALWGVTPYAVVESMAYSELVFTAFAAWAMYAAVTHRWIWAGTLSTLAGLSRPTGVAVAVAVGLGAFGALVVRWWRRRDRKTKAPAWWRPVLGAAIAPLGFAGYIGWVGLQKGSWDGYFKVQEAWESQFDFGRSTYKVLRAMLMNAEPVWLTDAMVAGTLAASVLLFAVCVLQRQPLTLLVFSGMMLLLALGDAAYFNSRARFLIPAFALLLPLAAGLARLRTKGAAAAVLAFAALCSASYGGYVVFVYTNSP
ncbi:MULTISPECIES: glycosyltransferase family 39 protein [Kitasatospora]|uniref:Glycosyltransferase family 39 protein n=1 Tax=Kitasatospora cystarginea TaxID=58350 RepID=A0ABP5QAG0_9ACTN